MTRSFVGGRASFSSVSDNPLQSPSSLKLSVLRGSVDESHSQSSSNHSLRSSNSFLLQKVVHNSSGSGEGNGREYDAQLQPSSEVLLQINIPCEMFRDKTVKSDKEVEFSFDMNNDNFAVENYFQLLFILEIQK